MPQKAGKGNEVGTAVAEFPSALMQIQLPSASSAKMSISSVNGKLGYLASIINPEGFPPGFSSDNGATTWTVAPYLDENGIVASAIVGLFESCLALDTKNQPPQFTTQSNATSDNALWFFISPPAS
jgi:hypothetical protein